MLHTARQVSVYQLLPMFHQNSWGKTTLEKAVTLIL